MPSVTFEPKHSQPFTFEQACLLDAPTIAEEISRLQNSLRVLSSTQRQLQDAIAGDDNPDPDLQEAFRDNVEVVQSQEERIFMLRKALEAQGAAIADNPHYRIDPHDQSSQLVTLPPEAASAPVARPAPEQSGSPEDGVAGGLYL